MLSDALDVLACPLCAGALELDGRTLACALGHRFDVARQGYVSLLAAPTKFSGDSADMIAARERFLGSGHFAPLIDAVAAAVGSASAGPVVLEVGAGTGHYLAAVLDSVPDARGVGIDVSKYAARRAARCHARAASVLADVWDRLPVRDGAVDVALSVFAPRNAAELQRLLAPRGVLVVLTPTTGHLRQLVDGLGLVHVDERKSQRLDETLSGRFERLERRRVEFSMTLSHNDVEAVVAMGPSARHLDAKRRAEAIAALPEPLRVDASAEVAVYRRRDAAAGDVQPAQTRS
ncbi:methyltransferase domain-containing protein [Rhodococcus sp. D2-41]|uniref:putative RNA methyltransferase n=1 Tax=Speluncibacter jeojiensis TaxID=2710754 RepID=UPI00240ED4D6|nr:methyltransferase domain-containing protein [Rhodococcus sp. D2-41]MDG3012506.1 methyltransferase domain-containing protein [Rhodococcus sp. D2-41]